MKKFFASVLAFTLVFGTMASATVFAGTIPKIYLNGNKMLVQQSPFNDNGSMMVPLRTIAVNLGADVAWDADTQTATITQGYNTVSCRINDTTARKNAQIITLNAPAQLKDGTTYVPLRFVSEAFGADVQYDSAANAVNITCDVPRVDGKEYDPWGRGIRTTDLPDVRVSYGGADIYSPELTIEQDKNRADEFAYILDSVPNEMYEVLFNYDIQRYKTVTTQIDENTFHEEHVPSTDWKAGVDYCYPKDIAEFDTTYYSPENLQLWKEVVEKNLDLKLNVDYRTVDEGWVQSIILTQSGTSNSGLESYYNSHLENAQEYVDYIKENHIVVEGDYYVEPSICYVSGNGTYIRCWARFRATSDKTEWAELLDSQPQEFKTNRWYAGYVDIELATMNSLSTGDDFAVYGDRMVTSIVPLPDRR